MGGVWVMRGWSDETYFLLKSEQAQGTVTGNEKTVAIS